MADTPTSRKLQRTFYAVNDAVVFVNNEGRVDHYNHAASSLLSPKARSVPEGQLLSDLLGSAAAGSAMAAMLQRARMGRRESEIVLRGRLHRVTVDPVYDDHGRLDGGVVVLCDIADSRRANSEVVSADADASSSRRQEDFLGVLAHELRNPLNAISAANTVLGQSAPDEETAAKLRTIIGRQVKTLARLIDDLLEVSRLARGHLQLQREAVDLGEVARRASDELRPALESRRQSLSVHLSKEPLVCLGDAARLDQIIGNLLANAAKFSEPGSSIDLSVVAVRMHAERWIEIAVRDNGVGVPPDMLDAIFEPFVQVDPAISRSMGGLGIGLTMVKTLAELHGGSVAVESSGVGRGSRFVVRLPASEVALETPRVEPPTGAPAPPKSGAGKKLTILVIEDNTDALELVVTWLRGMGHAVHGASDGPSGVELALAINPDVALVDVGLPVVDGYQVAKRIRASEVSGMYLVAVTGYGRPEDRARAFDAGFDAHLVKPVEEAKLRRLLERHGDGRGPDSANLARPTG